MTTATAQSCANIAFIKYWGDRDASLRIPANSSLSMNLDGLTTRTQVSFDPSFTSDCLTINDQPASGLPLQRVSALLDRVRKLAGLDHFASVESRNNFPTGAGIASSASAFAALALAASTAAGLELSETELSRLARTGSGSACRSVPAGFVEWQAGSTDQDSYAFSIASPGYWDLVDCIAIVSEHHKPVGSDVGHSLATTSPLQNARLVGAPGRLEACRQAILARDFEAFARVTELDCNLMHAVMLTSAPALLYWQPDTLAVIQTVVELHQAGWPVCYTIDAGPNVHVICQQDYAVRLVSLLEQVEGVQQVLSAPPGGPARLL